MQLLGARYYLPALGRFLTPDPIGHEGGLNLYAYCGDSPLTKVDPSGKQAIQHSDIWFQINNYDPLGTYGHTPHVPSNYTPIFWISQAYQMSHVGFVGALTLHGTVAERSAWFFTLVKPGGPMDFKHYETQKLFPFDAHFQELVDYGNFNFGVIGTALGFNPNYLMWAAGAAARHGSGGEGYSTNAWPTYGDQWRDNFFIQMGIQWYNSTPARGRGYR